MTVFNFISLFGGLALFLYGMRLMGDGLQHGSSGALKSAMERVTNNPLVGFLLGLVLTAAIQSSTATIVLTSGLVGAGIITLHQSLGIILGANVGTTITAQIIRLLDISSDSSWVLNLLRPSTLAPIAAIIGILLIMAFSSRNSDTVGKIAMGFGILFTGLLNMTAAVSPLSQSEGFSQIFLRLADTPLLGFLAGTGVAFLIQSSSATIGILQALSVTGALTLSSVYAIIIGVNMGDCITTAIVCSIGSKADAKRTGMVHIIFNVMASLLVIIAITILHRSGALDSIWERSMSSGNIANLHTLFRLVSAIVLLPVCGQFEKLSRVIIKDDPQIGESVDRELEELDEKFFTSPALALSSVKNTISTMSRMSKDAVLSAMDVLVSYDKKAIDVINQNEDHIDTLADHVDNYLLRLSPHVPPGKNNDMLNYYMQCFPEFERIGDYAVNLTENAAELRVRNAKFSESALNELGVLKDALSEILEYTQTAFNGMDMHAARHIEPIEEVVDDLVARLRANHIHRLRTGRCTVYAGLTFLDVLVNVERIADQCSNVGIYTLSQSDSAIMKSHHDYIHWLHRGGDELFNTEYQQAHERYFSRLGAPEVNE